MNGQEESLQEVPLAKKLWILFSTFARIAALVVGGGYAILPVAEETFSVKHKWLKPEELLDMMALVQTIPGIIACNMAVYIGMKLAGIPGMLAAALGVCFPSVTMITLIAMFFPDLQPENPMVLAAFAGIRACVTGLILFSAIKMIRKVLHDTFSVVCAVCAFVLLLMKVNPVYIILASMPAGICFAVLMKYRKEKRS